MLIIDKLAINGNEGIKLSQLVQKSLQKEIEKEINKLLKKGIRKGRENLDTENNIGRYIIMTSSMVSHQRHHRIAGTFSYHSPRPEEYN